MAIEHVRGSLTGRGRAFGLARHGRMAQDVQVPDSTIVPDPGRGAPAGIVRSLSTRIAKGQRDDALRRTPGDPLG